MVTGSGICVTVIMETPPPYAPTEVHVHIPVAGAAEAQQTVEVAAIIGDPPINQLGSVHGNVGGSITPAPGSMETISNR